jgi:methionyl-tRNA synthetase
METQETQQTTLPEIKPEITFEEFLKLDIRLCQILSVEKVEGKDKLYKMEINTGIDQRTVVSAIAQIYTPEELRNKVLPFVLNLTPRKIAGIESKAMIILAESQANNKTFQISAEDNVATIGSIVI